MTPRPRLTKEARAPMVTEAEVTTVNDVNWVHATVHFVMTPTMHFPEPPSANRWWRNVNGRMVTSREARAYKHDTALRALAAGFKTPLTGPVRVEITWWRGRKSGDLDKRIGVLLDALQGVCYESDSQITEIHAFRKDDPKNPRVMVRVSSAPALSPLP